MPAKLTFCFCTMHWQHLHPSLCSDSSSCSEIIALLLQTALAKLRKFLVGWRENLSRGVSSCSYSWIFPLRVLVVLIAATRLSSSWKSTFLFRITRRGFFFWSSWFSLRKKAARWASLLEYFGFSIVGSSCVGLFLSKLVVSCSSLSMFWSARFAFYYTVLMRSLTSFSVLIILLISFFFASCFRYMLFLLAKLN